MYGYSMFYMTEKDIKNKRTEDTFVFTRSLMCKIEFSWENSTYLQGKLICLNGFGGLKFSKPAIVTANYDPAAQQNIASGSHFSESWIANSRKSKQCENTGKKIRFGGKYF